MFQKIKLSLAVLTLVFAVSAPLTAVFDSQPAHAQAAAEIEKGMNQSGGDKNKTTLPKFLETIVNILLFLIGSIAVISIIISGIRFVTANGNSDQIKSARDGILYSAIGIVVALMAFAIVRFIVSNLK